MIRCWELTSLAYTQRLSRVREGQVFRRLTVALALSACALWSVAGSVLAEEPWVAQMPSVAKVTANTQGPNAFDTGARQWVAFDSLFSTIDGLMGDRFVAGGMTAAEKELRDAYNTERARVLRDLKESLPEAERAFVAGTKFAEWSALRDHYFADPTFNNTLLAKLFSADFRSAHAAVLDASWLFEGRSGLTPTSGNPVTSNPVTSSSVTPALGSLLPDRRATCSRSSRPPWPSPGSGSSSAGAERGTSPTSTSTRCSWRAGCGNTLRPSCSRAPWPGSSTPSSGARSCSSCLSSDRPSSRSGR